LGKDGVSYLELKKIEALGGIEKVIVPESTNFIPSSILKEKKS